MDSLRRVFGTPYRVFFLSAGVYAVLSVLVWEFWLAVHAAGGMMSDLPFQAAPHLWHAHEMIFGYASAAIGGFLLTAVPNWTGSKTAPHRYVIFAASLWVGGRVAVLFSAALPAGIVAGVDLAFLPLLALQVAGMLVRRPKPQNVMFLVFLTLLWLGNLMVHLEWIGVTDDTLATGLRVGLGSVGLMIAVLGGRVTPAFTRNAMKRAGVIEAHWPRTLKAADIGAILCLGGFCLALILRLPDPVAGTFALAGGGLQILRIGLWRPFWTRTQPILWSLHLSMAMLGLGMILWGAALLGLGSEVAALHVLGIGAVGGMTLAVMSRAILGHTGRPLVAPGPVALAFVLVATAAVLRWSASTFSGSWYFPASLMSGALWILAFTLFVATLWPALTQPRAAQDA